jgi:hypothetical protein
LRIEGEAAVGGPHDIFTRAIVDDGQDTKAPALCAAAPGQI